jgi:endonuclease-3
VIEIMSDDEREALVQKYRNVYQKLLESYGRATWRQHLPPLDELVSTILSQATSDINRDKSFHALQTCFPDWESVMNANESDLIDTIRPAGLANQKGPRIQAALLYVKEQQGALTLEFLAEMPLAEAKSWLMKMKGVGPKTAAIVLLFAFGRSAFPVDTHVYRITSRLGLINAGVNADRAHDILEAIGDSESFYPMHLNLIRHGREICLARNPKCVICPLQTDCNYFQTA